ncbi:hypothetical protein ACMD2_18017 [Ananas comosus]|uniref:Uncharacterized protein n=1 Tax=Ananas comosus TaxID=4615 RepID=A0A199VFU7_ANACO|nr:hypothetical protein ACMD2_18017 [Ananas comosus]
MYPKLQMHCMAGGGKYDLIVPPCDFDMNLFSLLPQGYKSFPNVLLFVDVVASLLVRLVVPSFPIYDISPFERVKQEESGENQKRKRGKELQREGWGGETSMKLEAKGGRRGSHDSETSY